MIYSWQVQCELDRKVCERKWGGNAANAHRKDIKVQARPRETPRCPISFFSSLCHILIRPIIHHLIPHYRIICIHWNPLLSRQQWLCWGNIPGPLFWSGPRPSPGQCSPFVSSPPWVCSYFIPFHLTFRREQPAAQKMLLLCALLCYLEVWDGEGLRKRDICLMRMGWTESWSQEKRDRNQWRSAERDFFKGRVFRAMSIIQNF